MTQVASVRAAASRAIEQGKTALGIEFGSTRIKAVLVDDSGTVLATGSHDWANQLVDEVWTYSEEAIWGGLQAAYADVTKNVRDSYGLQLTTVGGLGISAMMHGYVALDAKGQLLVPFRTWRNTNTGEAVAALSKALNFAVPHRWSCAHLYQAVLDGESHVPQIAHLTTLAGLVHLRLTGKLVLGIGDASGMFPIDSATGTYDARRLRAAEELLAARGFTTPLADLLPRVLPAGRVAGQLTAEGAALLDPTGTLQPGIPFAPPEGDAGTGMVATNSVAPKTGNVSAGTSIFAMVVLEKDLAAVHPELDLVTTPDGFPVAMVHSNNGTSEWDQWVKVFGELLEAAGAPIPKPEVYDLAYAKALEGAPDAGGLLAYNFLSGEPIVGLEAGRPLFVRSLESPLSLGNFLRAQLMTIFGVLALGMRILVEEEGVKVERLAAHGGLFKTPLVAQTLMADALAVPVEVTQTAGEGGPWGMALLALYANESGERLSLPEFLQTRIFGDEEVSRTEPTEQGMAGFTVFMDRFVAGLPIEVAAVQNTN